MLPTYNNKNSWSLSVENRSCTKYYHHYFCSCSAKFKLQTEINEPDAPEILCPQCGNDYFKDAMVFEKMQSTRIWKYFNWVTVFSEDKESWYIVLKYETPVYNDSRDEVTLCDKKLLDITLKKDGSLPLKIEYRSKVVFKYSLFLDEKVQALKKLLVDEAKERLYHYVMTHKSEAITWIDDHKIKEFSVDDRFKYITFFLKNSHLKEHYFFFWKMDGIDQYTLKYTTQVQMLDFIVNKRKEKSVKKALYHGYENSIKNVGYYPYSDYIFSRSIENVDLLVKLYGVHPEIKKHLFTDETITLAITFILFLKRYYTEKQIVKLFVENIQDIKEYKLRLNHWEDTLRMLQTMNAFNALEEHFSKVKLTTKKLHDEIVRVFHIVSYELDAKENFEYDEVYESACSTYKELEFKLPLTVAELSLWSKILHNCMFGYSRRIHQQRSIIYGVFKENELLYAIELNGFHIVQSRAVSNGRVPSDDMSMIDAWKNKYFLST